MGCVDLFCSETDNPTMEATTKQLYIFSFVRAFSLVALGERKDGDEATNLFIKGANLYAESLMGHPGDALAYNNYAIALYHLGIYF